MIMSDTNFDPGAVCFDVADVGWVNVPLRVDLTKHLFGWSSIEGENVALFGAEESVFSPDDRRVVSASLWRSLEEKRYAALAPGVSVG